MPGTSKVHVVATTLVDTRAALTTASHLAGAIGAELRVIVPKVVSYSTPDALPTPNLGSAAEIYRAMASEMGIDANVQLCVCGRISDAYRMLFPEHSIIVIGGRRRLWPWPNATERAAQKLEHLGHRVLVADSI
jgi:hypothetical protein